MAPTPEEKDSLLPGISNCPMNPTAGTNTIPGYEERNRTLYVKMLESGTYLDHLTDYPGLGEMLFQTGNSDLIQDPTSPVTGNSSPHSMGSSGTSSSFAEAQKIRKHRIEAAVPEGIRHLFPQLQINSSFPPTYLVHGTNDRAVECRESKEMSKQLAEVGVKNEIVLAGGLGHLFDSPGISGTLAQMLWERYLGEVVPFLKRYLTEESG